jgi:hypothetical protein
LRWCYHPSLQHRTPCFFQGQVDGLLESLFGMIATNQYELISVICAIGLPSKVALNRCDGAEKQQEKGSAFENNFSKEG